MGSITNSEKIPEEAIQVLEIIEELLADRAIGVYLYGSAMLGGLQVNSDVDILVIVGRKLTDEIRYELTGRLLLISGKTGNDEGKRPLEVTIVSLSSIVPWRFPPKCEFMYGEWLREQIETGDIPGAGDDPELTILLWQARSSSIALKGPEAEEITAPVPMEDVRRAFKELLPELTAGLKGDERNVLLTLARMWFTLSTGGICSKDHAAIWAVPKLPGHASLLEMAGRAYLGKEADCWDDLGSEAALLAEYISRIIEEL